MHQDILRYYKQPKWVQLIVLSIITIISFTVLFSNSELRKSLYSNRALFLLAAFMWGLLLFSFVCLLYDFMKMKFFVRESHALNKAAYLDKMTDLPNRNSLDTVFLMGSKDKDISKMGCSLIRISNLPKINDEKGHDYGDRAIQAFSYILESVGDNYGFVGRNGGNEFLAIIENCDAQKMDAFLRSIKSELAEYNGAPNSPVYIEIKYVYTLNSELNLGTFTELITNTYRKLHRV